MEPLEIIIQLLVLLGMGYLVFFKTYFAEKGRNLATKEDLEEITKIVENVKNEIHFSTQSKLSIKAEERNALVDGYVKHSYWLKTILGSYFATTHYSNPEPLDLISPKLEDARFQFELAEARIELFVAHGDLTKEMGGLKLATMELQHLVEATADELRLFFFKTKMELDQTPVDQKVNRHQKYIEEYSEKMKAFREHKLKIYAEIAPICSQFRNLAHSHIENLIESGERKT